MIGQATVLAKLVKFNESRMSMKACWKPIEGRPPTCHFTKDYSNQNPQTALGVVTATREPLQPPKDFAHAESSSGMHYIGTAFTVIWC